MSDHFLEYLLSNQQLAALGDMCCSWKILGSWKLLHIDFSSLLVFMMFNGFRIICCIVSVPFGVIDLFMLGASRVFRSRVV